MCCGLQNALRNEKEFSRLSPIPPSYRKMNKQIRTFTVYCLYWHVACKVARAAWAVGGDHPSRVSWHRPVAPSVIRDLGALSLVRTRPRHKAPVYLKLSAFLLPRRGLVIWAGNPHTCGHYVGRGAWWPGLGAARGCAVMRDGQGSHLLSQHRPSNIQDVAHVRALSWIIPIWSISSRSWLSSLSPISPVMSVSVMTFSAWSRPGHWTPHAAPPRGDQWPVCPPMPGPQPGLQPKC